VENIAKTINATSSQGSALSKARCTCMPTCSSLSVSPTDLRAYLLVLPGLVLLRTIFLRYIVHCVLIKRIPNIFSCNSRFVSLNCGIRQGGVLPLYLFALYIDSIFDKVKHNGLGCNIKWFCLSVFLYADDILLLATTVVTYLRNRASVD